MKSVAALSLLLLASACGSAPATKQFLDPLTSVTVNYTDTPIVLYVDRSGRAAFARDYVNIGPIQINRMGRHRYYVWFGIWNTIEITTDNRRTDGFELVTVYADGEPILLDLAGWTADAIGATQTIYIKPVSSAAEAYYEVTLDQIRLLAEAREIRMQTTGENSTSYELWDSSDSARRGFREFLAEMSY